jgi:hypothetical protein
MRVIAKAYGDRPLDRLIVGETKRVYFVASASALGGNDEDDDLVGVGFPKDCIFHFEAALYESLEAVWRSGDREQLTALWSAARPIGATTRHAA